VQYLAQIQLGLPALTGFVRFGTSLAFITKVKRENYIIIGPSLRINKFIGVLLLSICQADTNLDYQVNLVQKDNLYKHVNYLVNTPNYRNHLNIDVLNSVADYIKDEFETYGLKVREQKYQYQDNEYKNIIGLLDNGKGKKIVVGAHYDVCQNQAGADDNASGISGLLEMARILAERKDTLDYDIEFVAYTLEEPPFFNTRFMGSYIHAESLILNDEKIEFMLCLEMIGYFTNQPKSQEYPLGLMKMFYSRTGNFIAAVSNFGSSKYIRKINSFFRKSEIMPIEQLSAPSFFGGIDFSDHRNYWHFGFKAIMITDTAFYRNKNYHSQSDTIEPLDFNNMARVVEGLSLAFLNNIF
jgi:hypothetical protein